ncbi:FAD-dependent monooxygenase [Streptomyces sp. INA 01156]
MSGSGPGCSSRPSTARNWPGRNKQTIQLWATANGEPKAWVSERELDPDARTIRFAQTVTSPPVAEMAGEWRVLPLSEDSCTVELRHTYRAENASAESLAWIARAVDTNSTKELSALKFACERDADSELSPFTFTDSVDTTVDPVLLFSFLDRGELWAGRLEHVAEAEMREFSDGLQLLRMRTRTPDGDTHVTESYRVSQSPARLLYKQVTLPALLLLHTGEWTITRPGELAGHGEAHGGDRPRSGAGAPRPRRDGRGREAARPAEPGEQQPPDPRSSGPVGRRRCFAEVSEDMTEPEAPDVLVVGAGPSGLLLSGILAKGGARVTVLESRNAPSPQPVPPPCTPVPWRSSTSTGSSSPRSCPGAPTDTTAACPWTSHRSAPGGRGLEVPSAGTGADADRLGPPARRAAAPRGACGVRPRARRALSGEHPHRYDVQRGSAGRGGRAGSTVRSLLGVECGGAPATRVLVQADFRHARLARRRFERHGRYTVTAAPISAEFTRVMMHDPRWPEGEARTLEDLRTAWETSTGETLPAKPSWLRTFGDDTKVAHPLVKGRVVLCGDAAHPFIPIGGQALNTSLMDADALGWRVLGHLDDGDPQALLDYQDERFSWLNVLAGRLRAQARLLFDTDAATAEHKALVAGRLDGDEAYRGRIADSLAGVDVCYLTPAGAVRRRLSRPSSGGPGGPGASRVQRALVPTAKPAWTPGSGPITTGTRWPVPRRGRTGTTRCAPLTTQNPR